MSPEPVELRGSILGTRVQRTEDPGLLTGVQQYLADLPLEHRLHAVFVRSDVPHGELRAVHVEDALAVPGVVAVWRAAELALPSHHGFAGVADVFLRSPLATDRVRWVGEPIAVVLAESLAIAEDAAALVWADIEPLVAHIDPEAALREDAAPIFPEHGSNLALADAREGTVDLEAVSDRVVRGRYVNQRIAVAAMEPDCCAAEVGSDGRLVVYPSNQLPHLVRDTIAEVLGLSVDDVHVVTPQVGGGFGGKAGLHHEYSVVASAAYRLRRPVQWVPSRSEDMIGLLHGRGQIQYAELGCRADGTFTGLRVRVVADAGAFPSVGAFLPAGTRMMSQGTYDFPAIDFDYAVAITNTTPMGAYRGAGRPEATALLERLVDQASIELRLDPIELRVRNLIPGDAFPFATRTGAVYDTGNYESALRKAAEVVSYGELREQQAARRARGDRVQLGIGVACYVEITAGGPARDFASVEVHPDGAATVCAGTAVHGQGHQTAYAMLVSDCTGIEVHRIRLVDGDTDRVPWGNGTGASRSLQVGGSAVRLAAVALVERAREIAAHLLEADVADVIVDQASGAVGVVGVPASALTWAELARRAAAGDYAALTGEAVFDQETPTFPFGAHIAVVEVDTETGAPRLTRHVAVDDCGTVLNPLLVEGQQHGGIGSGLGQALYEEIRFDDAGNPLTTNFADYGIPSAAEMASFDAVSTETPSPRNPLGAKGIGESATIGSTPAIQNAVIDAVSHLGVRHIDLPCSPERVWRAISDARSGQPQDPWSAPPEIFDTIERNETGNSAVSDAAASA